jgi:hypothetical protein
MHPTSLVRKSILIHTAILRRSAFTRIGRDWGRLRNKERSRRKYLRLKKEREGRAKKCNLGRQVWWHIPAIPELGRLRQEDG